ncbi:MAG TPA: lipoyl(octanoyl) transferase LipB [Chloroflexia bacterium]|nr:lipoyl(octanoyl) transferase LipB [Chloroflexia bacterium]
MDTSLEIAQRASLGLRPLSVLDLGLIAYSECWELQRRIAASVAAGDAPSTLLLLEHPHTYTCGRRGGRDHILISEDELAHQGITVLDVDRGGDVTYHGPGQLVAYPIIDLNQTALGLDYPGYVRTLERVLLGVLANFSIKAYQLEGYSGAWVESGGQWEKIAAIGVKVDGRGVTSHGIALNVATDLRYFSYIVPCGITDKGVISMSKVAGASFDIEEVKAAFVSQFAQVFGFALME